MDKNCEHIGVTFSLGRRLRILPRAGKYGLVSQLQWCLGCRNQILMILAPGTSKPISQKALKN
jgi:hypothetical protein